MFFINPAIAPYKTKAKRHRDFLSYNQQMLLLTGLGLAGTVAYLLVKKYKSHKMIQRIRNGEITEQRFVREFAEDFLKNAKITIPNNSPEMAEYINNSLNIIKRARKIDDLLKVFPGDNRLLEAKRLFQSAGITRDHAIKRMIDMKVRKAVRQSIRDAGVKGMKKGEHVKARDPEYVESLRNGGGQQSGSRPAPQKNNHEFAKGVASGALGGLVGGAIYNHTLGKGANGKVSNQRKAGTVVGAVAAPAAIAGTAALIAGRKGIGRALKSAGGAIKSIFKSKGAKQAAKALPETTQKTASSVAKKGTNVAGKNMSTSLTRSSSHIRGEGIKHSRNAVAGAIANNKASGIRRQNPRLSAKASRKASNIIEKNKFNSRRVKKTGAKPKYYDPRGKSVKQLQQALNDPNTVFDI